MSAVGDRLDQEQPKKRLRLMIELEGFYADDLDDLVADCFSDDDPAFARHYIVTEEWMKPDVVVTVCTVPGEKCMNDDFELAAFRGLIVAAETAPIDG